MGSEGSKEASSHGIEKEGEGDDHDRGTTSRQNPITPLNHAIRQRLRHGVNYNLKIILKGRKGSGKTTLWKRLQGMKFYPQVIFHFNHLNSYILCPLV